MSREVPETPGSDGPGAPVFPDPDKLSPCPACGSTDILIHTPYRDELGDPHNLHVWCLTGRHGCGLRGPIKESKEAASNAWNELPRRPPPPEERQGTEKFRQYVEFIAHHPGLTSKAIAEHFGVHKSTAHARLSSLNASRFLERSQGRWYARETPLKAPIHRYGRPSLLGQALSLLKDIQWGTEGMCPACQGSENYPPGHSPSCPLAALIHP